MALLKVENLTYCYGGSSKPSLNNINLEINEGEFVLLAGKSGSGKSTLLRALSGLVPEFYGGSVTGNVVFQGKNIRDWHKGKLAGEIGFIFQDPEQQIVMTNVEKEIVFGLENTGVPPREMKRRVAEVMDFLGISHLKRKNIFELSGGHKQMVVLASVLAMQPKVLLLDEPTSQLDPVSAEKIITNIRRINEDLGITVIIAEQRLERCMHLADKMVVINKGCLASNLTPGETVKLELDKQNIIIPPLPKLFAAVGCSTIPLTVSDGRAVLRTVYGHMKPAVDGRGGIAKTTVPANNLLKIEKASFTYPDCLQPAIRDINLKVGSGEFVAIIGENGGGKSTLLKNICGLLRPQEGSIIICNKDIKKQSVAEIAGTVGYLGQNANDYLFNETVFEEVAFGLKVRGIKDRDIVDKMLEKWHLTDLKNKNPRDLSRGERQWVALAAVLVMNPQILLLDEPTRGLDASLKHELGTLLKKLTAEGVAVIIVTHDIEFIAEYAGRVVVIFDGEIVADGDKQQVLNNSLYYAPQLNKLFRGFCQGVITFQDALKLLKVV
ncbi:ABC transporter ATP-binding protein [Desulfofalx alkaliphila]|uniref:ABC transporter ATP-binding protein n=1 Tax=Desulfofalx alkaliphila TaxID=105483 RepID=UPI0004E0CCE6|nr:ABC transporter ATP-binding protein [Desulfofalx alkaliphila]